jgi:hypothetical protein
MMNSSSETTNLVDSVARNDKVAQLPRRQVFTQEMEEPREVGLELERLEHGVEAAHEIRRRVVSQRAKGFAQEELAFIN